MAGPPSAQASAMSGALRRPFTEQIAFFRGKLGNLVPTEFWDDLVREQHDTGFMVAGAQKADLLTDLAAAVDRTIAEGKSLDAFRKDFRAIVQRHGWHGWTGEGTKAGEAWRTRTIYKTNASTSYAAGRYAQLLD
ncbi:MAG: phage head protein, partial [Sphingobium limneticum]